MATNDKEGTGKIWLGPGVLRPGPDAEVKHKKDKPLTAGDEIPKGYVSSERLKQLVVGGYACTGSDYAKHRAAGGAGNAGNAAEQIGQMKALLAEQTEANKALEKALAAATAKIEELEAALANAKAEKKGGK